MAGEETLPIDHSVGSAAGTVLRGAGGGTVQGAKAGGGFLGAVGKFLGGFGGGTIGTVVGGVLGFIVTGLFISTGLLPILIGVGVGAAVLGLPGLALGGAVGKGIGYLTGAPIGAVPGAAAGLVNGAVDVVREKTEAKRRVNTVPEYEPAYLGEEQPQQLAVTPAQVAPPTTFENEPSVALEHKIKSIIDDRRIRNSAENSAVARVEQAREQSALAAAER